MTLKDLYDWVWYGEGYYILNGFIQAWNLIDMRRERENAVPSTEAPPDDGQGPWHGGPCYPQGEFEDAQQSDILRELGLARP